MYLLLRDFLIAFKFSYDSWNFVFRALKTRGNTPKYGLIFHSSFIGRASARNKGRMARYLANKCSIASRIDCFAGNFCYYDKLFCLVLHYFPFKLTLFHLLLLQKKTLPFLGRNFVNKLKSGWTFTIRELHLVKTLMWWKLQLKALKTMVGMDLNCSFFFPYKFNWNIRLVIEKMYGWDTVWMLHA